MRIEVSLIMLRNRRRTVYKVTKRVPSLGVSETKIFVSLEEARLQFDEWRSHLFQQ
jgi:hypothetical protein